MRLNALPCFLVLAGSATIASAQTEFLIDVNSLSAQASGPFSGSFTGDLFVFGSFANPDVDADARIVDVVIDGFTQGVGAAPGEFSFEMNIEFNGGDIVSGGLFVAHDEMGAENTYSTTLSPGVDSILPIGGGNFIIGGLTVDGGWSDPNGTFLGLDISPWGQNVPGMFAQVNFNPDSNFFDPDTHVDVFILVPAPTSAAGLALGLGLLGRRRR